MKEARNKFLTLGGEAHVYIGHVPSDVASRQPSVRTTVSVIQLFLAVNSHC